MLAVNANRIDHSAWNRRLINIYWVSNAVILVVELIVAVVLYMLPTSPVLPDFAPPLPVYMYRFVLIPSSLIFMLTAGCEIAVRRMRFRYKHLQPYIVTLTCVAFCAVLIIIHYSVNVIMVAYALPLFFSLVYNDKRILSYTFLLSLVIFFGVYVGYFIRVDLPFLKIHEADVPTSTAILLISYLICRTILNRFDEIVKTMTEAERAASEAASAQKRAEAIAQARTKFLANMSHEFRTPMNGIIGLSELMLDDSSIPQEHQVNLLRIKNSASGLSAVINDILDVTEFDAGEVTLRNESFDLRDLLGECEALTSNKAAEKGLRLYAYDNAKLKNKIIGDPAKLRQALLHLLSNAIKFTEDGTVTLVAKREAQESDNGNARIRFEVGDTGIGMTREQCAKIFEPFHQADSSVTRSFGGTGLGLALTKAVVELMGGEIEVRSLPEAGSRFSFTLDFPLSGEKSESETEKAQRPVFDGDALICEDDEVSQHVAVQNLEKLGFNVTLAENGQQGLDMAIMREKENKPFNIIFMDINMPVMDGLSAAEKMIETGIKTPIIAMTAVTMTNEREKYTKAGMADCLRKPFKSRELWACLLKYLKPIRMEEQTESITHKPPVWREEGLILDRKQGIDNFMGNEQAYLNNLDIFFKCYSDPSFPLETAIEAGDFEHARLTAHKEMGSAMNIGAERLSRILMLIEEACSGDGSYYDSALIARYKEEHEKVLACISEMKLIRE